jgi:hypothetical protein
LLPSILVAGRDTAGYPTQLWTLERVVKAISREFSFVRTATKFCGFAWTGVAGGWSAGLWSMMKQNAPSRVCGCLESNLWNQFGPIAIAVAPVLCNTTRHEQNVHLFPTIFARP